MSKLQDLYSDLWWLMVVEGSYTVRVQRRETGAKVTVFGDPDTVYEFTHADLDKERDWIVEAGRGAGQEGPVPAGEQLQAPDSTPEEEARHSRLSEGDK